jgi:hypothetical protein
MKKNTRSVTQQKNVKQPKKEYKWLNGEYERIVELKLILPYQFLFICKLMEVPPRKLIRDFIDNLSCAAMNREGRDKAKQKLVDYFIEHGYGRQHYTEESIRTIFKELDAIGMLWPEHGKPKLIDLTAKWRDKYHAYWFKKWYRMVKRK